MSDLIKLAIAAVLAVNIAAPAALIWATRHRIIQPDPAEDAAQARYLAEWKREHR